MRIFRPSIRPIAVALLATAALLGATAASPLAPDAAANPNGNCGEGVQTFRQQGPLSAWGVRVTGVDLANQLGTARGEFNLAVESPSGEVFKARVIPFDEFNSPSDFTTVSGETVRVSVNVVATPANGRSCNYVYDAPYPGAP